MSCSVQIDCKILFWFFFSVKIICAGPILKSKGVGVIFQKKSTEMLKKGQNIWEFGQKCTKFEYILKKGRRLRPKIEHNKRADKCCCIFILCHEKLHDFAVTNPDVTMSTLTDFWPRSYTWKFIAITLLLYHTWSPLFQYFFLNLLLCYPTANLGHYQAYSLTD